MRVLKHLLGWEKSLSKGTKGDHNILIQTNCTCQDNQQNPFHTQAVEEIICPILNLENVEMNILSCSETVHYSPL